VSFVVIHCRQSRYEKLNIYEGNKQNNTKKILLYCNYSKNNSYNFFVNINGKIFLLMENTLSETHLTIWKTETEKNQ